MTAAAGAGAYLREAMAGLWDLGRRGSLPEELRENRSAKRRLKRGRTLSETEFVVFDTELTGLDLGKDSIISIGAVRMRGSSIYPSREFYSLIRPESRLKGDSVVVHELTHSDLESARPLKEVLLDFVRFISDSILVGHFVLLDTSFLNRALRKHFGTKLGNPGVDTASLYDWLEENDGKFSRHFGRRADTRKDLFTLAEHHGLEVEGSHNALKDAYMTAQLFQRLLWFLPTAGVRSAGELLSVGRP